MKIKRKFKIATFIIDGITRQNTSVYITCVRIFSKPLYGSIGILKSL